MLISEEHKFIFIHVYKTGGTSITCALRPLCGISPSRGLPMHATAQDALDVLGDAFYGYTRFAVVRNPWDQLVSRYRVEHAGLPPERVPSFHDFVHARLAQAAAPAPGNFAQLPQAGFVCDAGGALLVPRLLRFEHLQADLAALLGDLGVPAILLPRINVTPGAPGAHALRACDHDYRSYYTPELWQHVEGASPDVPLWRALSRDMNLKK